MVIFLRGAIPPAHEHPEKLRYTKIEECEDMWTQLFHEFLERIGRKGELWYQGGDRVFKVDDTLTERWLPSFSHVQGLPIDLLFCRGGFPYYDHICKVLPRAKKIYYGAGKRFIPQFTYKKFDLVLVDTDKQYQRAERKGFKPVLFTKPAARLFVPDEDVDKNYDVCFMANGTQRKIKRHAFMIKSLAGSGLTVLALGNQTPELRRLAKKEGLDVTWKPWMLRKRLPRLISQCKVGLCCSNETDSAPRVISEYMACGLPVVVTKSVNIDQESYRGKCVEDDKLIYGIKCAKKMKSSRPYYDRYMSIDVCAEDLKNLVEVCIENRI